MVGVVTARSISANALPKGVLSSMTRASSAAISFSDNQEEVPEGVVVPVAVLVPAVVEEEEEEEDEEEDEMDELEEECCDDC